MGNAFYFLFCIFANVKVSKGQSLTKSLKSLKTLRQIKTLRSVAATRFRNINNPQEI